MMHAAHRPLVLPLYDPTEETARQTSETYKGVQHMCECASDAVMNQFMLLSKMRGPREHIPR